MADSRLVAGIFHAVCAREALPPTYSDDSYARYFASNEDSTLRFFSRFGGRLDSLAGTTVLDVGCGLGATCVEAARRGARCAVGVDIQARGLDWGRAHINERFSDLAERVRLIHTDGSLRELGDEDRFDIVVSKDSFEHYDDPPGLVDRIQRFIAPGGALVIGFGPLWKSPTGGHIDFMTNLPWAHLLFPEDVIMKERRRFRPDEDASRFEDILGGLNKMTLARFIQIMSGTGLSCDYLATNVSNHPAVRAMGIVSRVRPLREFFTTNVYSIWRRPL